MQTEYTVKLGGVSELDETFVLDSYIQIPLTCVCFLCYPVHAESLSVIAFLCRNFILSLGSLFLYPLCYRSIVPKQGRDQMANLLCVAERPRRKICFFCHAAIDNSA